MATLVRLAALGAAALLVSAPATASFCPKAPACSAFWAADAVFVGRVQTIEGRPPIDRAPEGGTTIDASMIVVMSDPYAARIEVLEAFRGPEGLRPGVVVDVGVWPSLSSGGTYLIYAHKGEGGRLIVGLCGRTKAVAEAVEDLRFARGLATDRSTEARVFGDVVWAEQPSIAPPRDPEDRLPRVTWIATARGSEWRFESDAAGHIEGRLPPGRYLVRVEAPSQYVDSGISALDIPDARACREIGVGIALKDSVSGRILDGGGRPVAGLRVHTITNYPGSWRPSNVYTDAAGFFLFSNLGAGDHDLYVGANILPTAIERKVHLAWGEHQVLEPLTLPANTALASIAGTVVDETGRPLEGAYVELDDVEHAVFNGRVTTAADGRYRFAAVPGRTYRLEAQMPLPPPHYLGDLVASEPIEAGAAVGPKPIVLRRHEPQ